MTVSLTPRLLGERLRQAREARGLTQQQVAGHLGLRNHQPILRMERGEREVSIIELTALARLYRRPLSFFISPETSRGEETEYSVLFRAGGLTEEDLAEVERVVRRCEEYAFLSRALGVTPSTAVSAHLEYEPATTREKALAQGERLAADARRILRLDDEEPIADLPGLLEEQGVGVFSARLPENVSGLSVGSARTGRCIVVNSTQRPGRNTFSVAHELCHLLLGEAAHICYAEEENRDLGEARAERFAAALLLPRHGLESYRRDALNVSWQDLNPVHVVELQFHFNVSYQAVLVRLRRLGLIGEAHYNRLEGVAREQLARLVGHDPEGDTRRPVAFERRLRALALEAFRLGRISRGRLAEVLGLDLDEVADLLRGLGIGEPAVQRRRGHRNPLVDVAG